MTTELVPATPLESAVQDIRLAQAAYEDACENYQRLRVELAESIVRKDAADEALQIARENMFQAAVKPTVYVTDPIRVMPVYRDEISPPIEEETAEAAWSDEKATDAHE